MNNFRGLIAWLLAAISVGIGSLAIASCGIPFVPPTFAMIFGTLGCLAAVVAVGFAFARGRTAGATFVVIGGMLLAVNGFAIRLGNLGKHLIDYLEGH